MVEPAAKGPIIALYIVSEAIILMLTVCYFLMVLTHLFVMFIRGPPLLTNVWLWIVNVLHISMVGIYGFFLIRDWKKVRAL